MSSTGEKALSAFLTESEVMATPLMVSVMCFRQKICVQHDDDTTTTTTTGQCSILVVDDGSTDGTRQYIQEKRQYWLVLIRPRVSFKKNYPKGTKMSNYPQISL
jgi:GT2 family glycosyltransferase